MKLRVLGVSVVLGMILPQAADAQTGMITGGEEHSSLLYTTLGALAGAGLGLGVAASLEAGSSDGSGFQSYIGLSSAFAVVGASVAADASGADPAWLQTAAGALIGAAASLALGALYEGVYSENDPGPGESMWLSVSLLIPPLAGTVVGNRIGQREE
jgi:hypothetical protein